MSKLFCKIDRMSVVAGPCALPAVVQRIGDRAGVTDFARYGWYPVEDEAYQADIEFLSAPVFDAPEGVVRRRALPRDLESVRTEMLARTRNARERGLEKLTKNSGVNEIYNLNYRAALLYKANPDDPTILKNGMTPAAHLLDLGSEIGMTADTFADYVITEMGTLAPTANTVEKAYLNVRYVVLPNTDDVKIIRQAVVDFEVYIDSISD